MELAQRWKRWPDALRLVVALAGRNDAASLRHPEHLTQRIPRIANVDQHLMAKRDVERLVRKWKLVDAALLKVDVLDAGHFGDRACPRQDFGVQVDAGDVAIGDELGKADGNGARAGADVQERQMGIG